MNRQLTDFDIPIGAWVERMVDWIQGNFTGVLDGISDSISLVVDALNDGLLAIPPLLLALMIVLLSWWRVGWKFALFAVLSMILIFGMSIWDETVSTLSLVIGSSLMALTIGIPIGIAMARNDTVEMVMRPILDFMQTMPPFVYLIPAAIFFGLGKVPGSIATLIFAMPPAVRLTNLGIRQVNQEHIEAGQAFGCTKRQLLFNVQLPLAMPSIMAGVNQTIMLALSMVVISSMIGAGGLGNTVLTGIQRLNVGLGFEGGLGVVLLAILLDRITQSIGSNRMNNVDTGHTSLWRRVKQAWTTPKGPSSA
uniref:Glycine betaine/proline transport system permease protein n=1 Tax=Candidatus Kentrum sp. TUN TaxID=2126343 RepID=A0A451AK06_9GAMM|nr:MAG: glycine betaine/proline transport system permease protein [Candidatus Kentron sp. TUN]VFK60976.1 MAG: glycine betaine/proline transport system permease protein [Candidatus Kentron sp. TUN]VFK66371.1 MAG: glycine betaine/proline transport system permease protein [Candidatus Kentron sp. TUN]